MAIGNWNQTKMTNYQLPITNYQSQSSTLTFRPSTTLGSRTDGKISDPAEEMIGILASGFWQSVPPAVLPIRSTLPVLLLRVATKKTAGRSPPSLPLEQTLPWMCRGYSVTAILRGFTRSAFGKVSVSTPWSTRALILSASIAGSSSNTRR